MRKQTMAVLACLVLGLAGALVAAAPAQAAVSSSVAAPGTPPPSCYGDYCSGTDPEATRCSADAYTVAHRNWAGWGVTLELRWSPTCKTNWARVNANPAASGATLRAVQCKTGYTQSGAANNGTYWWTRQIYSPQLTVRADWVGPPGSTSTACA
jgi:hypothetical protein